MVAGPSRTSLPLAPYRPEALSLKASLGESNRILDPKPSRTGPPKATCFAQDQQHRPTIRA